MSNQTKVEYKVENYKITEIVLPPFRDMLILGQGENISLFSITQAMDILNPQTYKILYFDAKREHEDFFKRIKIESDQVQKQEKQDDNVKAIILKKEKLKIMPLDKLLIFLRESVFHTVPREGVVALDFQASISGSNFIT